MVRFVSIELSSTEMRSETSSHGTRRGDFRADTRLADYGLATDESKFLTILNYVETFSLWPRGSPRPAAERPPVDAKPCRYLVLTQSAWVSPGEQFLTREDETIPRPVSKELDDSRDDIKADYPSPFRTHGHLEGILVKRKEVDGRRQRFPKSRSVGRRSDAPPWC